MALQITWSSAGDGFFRPSFVGSGDGSGGGSAALTGSGTISVPEIGDGSYVKLGTTINVTGAVLGDRVIVTVSVPFADGIFPEGVVTATNVVTIYVYNSSGAAVTPGSKVFTVGVYQ